MNEKEKKAIEELKSFKKDKDCKYWIGINGEKAIDIIINLIDKQQKEIEEYKKDYISRYTIEYLLDDYISKDKIKEKIKELKKQYDEDMENLEKGLIKGSSAIINNNIKINILQELLGETND